MEKENKLETKIIFEGDKIVRKELVIEKESKKFRYKTFKTIFRSGFDWTGGTIPAINRQLYTNYDKKIIEGQIDQYVEGTREYEEYNKLLLREDL
ncbi:hypothetical protein KAJ87_03215 [Candidatus Pacearchaeota archaeon]|nr:hypothetical protein [Candidatus Pacearchaeota archaeon]